MSQENPKSPESKMNFQSPTSGVAGKVEGDQYIINSPVTFETIKERDGTQQKLQLCRLKAFDKKIDNKYNGELVYVQLDFFREVEEEIHQSQGIGIILDISFGECNEKIIYPKRLGKDNIAHIRFGIKHGELRLNLQNGVMPMRERKFIQSQKEDWIVNATGNDNAPCWVFKANQEKAKVLNGTLKDEKLGYILDISDNRYTLYATFEIQISTNDIEIIAQDGVWDNRTNSKVRETKIRTFLKRVLEPKLKEYLSKVELTL